MFFTICQGGISYRGGSSGEVGSNVCGQLTCKKSLHSNTWERASGGGGSSGFGLSTFPKKAWDHTALWVMLTLVVPCLCEKQDNHQKKNKYQGVFQESQFQEVCRPEHPQSLGSSFVPSLCCTPFSISIYSCTFQSVSLGTITYKMSLKTMKKKLWINFVR